MGAGAVSAIGIALVTPRERRRQLVLDDAGVASEDLNNGQCHLRIVGVAPRRWPEGAFGDRGADLLGRAEVALTEGIADREPIE